MMRRRGLSSGSTARLRRLPSKGSRIAEVGRRATGPPGFAAGGLAARWYLLAGGVRCAGSQRGWRGLGSAMGTGLERLVAGVRRFLVLVGRWFASAAGWAGRRVREVALVTYRAVKRDPSRGKIAALVVGAVLSFLMAAGLAIAIARQLSRDDAGVTVLDVIVPLVVLILFGVVVVGPPLVRTLISLGEERTARLRAEERAEVAAHLHDSVLQTLMLIQRRAESSEVVALARTQERELRNWLYGARSDEGGDSFRRRLGEAMAEVEDRYGVRVTVVVVGDAAMDDRLEGVIGAAREAATNAAVHSGAASVDVFGEVGSTGVDVFVHDPGSGFDPLAVPGDRRGVADSIVARVERVGGRAQVDSQPGEGTEVALHVARGTP